jgi:hypothetical protein
MTRKLLVSRFMRKWPLWIYVVRVCFLKNLELYNVASFVVCDQWLLFYVEFVTQAMLTFRDLGLEMRSIYIFIYVSIVLSLDLGRFFSFSIYRESVRFLRRGISPSQGRFLHTEQQREYTRTNIHTLSGIRTLDPSIRANEDNSFLKTARPLWSAWNKVWFS